MRSKFFILTLMMMFCSLSFGQNNASTWGGDFNHHDYATNMQVVAKITVNDEVTNPQALQIAAFCGDERRSFVVNPTAVNNNYLVSLQIYGDKVHDNGGFGDDGNIIIKVYDGQSEYVLYTLQYNANDVIGGDLSDPDEMPNMVFNYVAKIGTTNYATLQAAIDAATENQIVTLIDNITLTSDLNNPAKGYFNVNADDKVIIDLNGKKITATENSSGNFILFYNYGELTFNDSQNSAIVELTATIDRDWNAQSSIVLNRGGKLTINGGKFIHKGGSDMAITICNSANSYGDAYMYVKGGEIISEKYIAIRMRMADPSQNGDPGNGVSNLEVTGGTISGYSRAIWGHITNPSSEQLGNLTITGGIIKGTNPDNKKAIEMDDDTHDNIDVEISGDAYIDGKLIGDYSDYAVSGGTFTVPVEEGFCAEGYIPVCNQDGTYGVVVDPAYGKVAKIGGTYYETLQEALNAITSGCTLDILTDITITEKWDCRYTGAKITVPVTINGNGKTIKFTGEISDGYNHLAAFRFEAPVTVNNLVVDMSEAVAVFQNRFSAISTKANLTVNESKFIGSTTYANSRAIIFGEGGHEGLEIVVNETEFINWKYGVVDNMNGGDVKSVTITGNKFDNANVQISALESITFTGNTTDSDVQITSYTANNTLDVTAKNNNLAANGTYTVKAGGTLDLQDEFLTPVADVNGKIYFTLQAALDYAVKAADVVTVKLLDDINLEGKTWTPVYFNSYIAEGTNTLIIDGNDKTISNLTDMLFSGTWTGKRFEVKNLTIYKANIKHNVEDAGPDEGVGAVVGNISATEEIEFNNVKLVNSHVEGGHWTGGLIGYAAGYSKNDGPVFTNIVIKNCEISGSTIVGKGSVGGVVGHATGDAWTSFGVEATKINNNTITSTGSSDNKAGIVMGTIGAAGTEQTTNNISLTGGVFVSVTELGNTAKSNGTPITRIYGRQGSSTGILTLTKGGSYQKNPIEENVAYAVVAPGFKLEQNTDGTYSVDEDPAYGKVAKIGNTYYETLAEAFAAAQDGDNVEIFVAGTYALTTSGKNITITGAVDGVVFDNIGAKNMGGANVTFNNVTFNYATNSTYKGLQHSGNLTYNNCTINGQVFLYGTSEEFNGCTFNQNSADAYNVWTYGAKEVDFNECIFNSVGKSVLIYTESATTFNTVTVTDCDFIASAPVEGKAAIEMDSSLSAGINLTIDGETTVNNFGSGNVSGNSLWNNKKGNETEANNDITVVVNNVTVLEPWAPVAKIGETPYETLAKAISAATAGQTITICSDVNENVTINKNLTIDGGDNNYTGTMTGNAGLNVTVQNLNFVNAWFDKSSKTTTGTYIFKNCSFDGYNATQNYAFRFKGANSVTIENCTVKYYKYSFLYVTSGTNAVTVKNVTVENCPSYGVYFASGVNSANIEDLTVKNSNNGFVINNTANRTLNLKDCKFENVITAINHSDGTNTVTCNLSGENDFGTSALSEYAKFVLTAADATLISPENLTVNVTTELDNQGYVVEYNEGVYSVVAGNVLNQTTGNKYATLQAAIDAASEGNTIVLLADITEDVTVNTSLTIDGKAEGATANSTYTGKMTVKADLTIKNVNFDGKGYNGYAVETRGASYLTVEDCTAKNYGYGFIQLASGTALTTVKNVTVSNMNYGVKVDYSNAVVLENVDIDCAVAAVLNSNYGEKTITIKDSDLSILGTWARNNTIKTTYVFEGSNTVDQFIIEEELDNFKLAIGATLTAAEGLNIKATEEGYVVEYNEGVYSVVAGNILNQTTDKKYAKLQAAIDEAENGDEIVVLKDITLGTGETREYTTTSGGTVSVRALNLISGKSVTIDLNGNTLYCEEEAEENQIYNFFAVTEEGHLTIKDSSEDGTGTVEIKNNDADATTVHSLIMCYNGTMTIENGNYKLHYGKNGNGMIYSQQSETVTVNGGNFWLGNVGTLENHSPWIFNASGRNGNRIIVNGGTFNDDVLHQYYAFEVESSVKNALVNNNDGTWSVITNGAVAHVTERYVYPANYTTNYTNTVGYATLKDAFAAAHTYNYVTEEEMSTVTMLKDVTLDAYVTISKSVNLNLGQFNITRVDGTALYFNGEGIEVTIDGEGTVSGTQAVYVDNGTVTINGGNYVGGYEAVYVINNGHAVINGGTFGAENDEDDTDFVLNEYDATRDVTTIAVYGGTFHGFNPENNAAEGAGTNFCAEGYGAVETAAGSNIWVVMPVQKQSLVAGWNWYSSYLKIKSEDLLLALGTNGSAVVSDNGGGDAYYDELYGWDNSLTENLDLSKMYMIETSIACDLNLAGELADASTITITLNPGWNWIGYPSNVKTRISNAFSGSEFTPENGDVIKTKANSFAEYYAGQWYDGGVDMTMEPTKGYMYYNASNVTKTFTYNIVPVRGTNETIAENHYSVDYTKYPFNMTMVAVVDGAMNDNYEVAALVNGEVRGSARPVYIESMDAYMLFLSINGDAVEEMTFKYYDLTTGEEYDLVNRIDYSNNAMVGSVNEPYVLSRGTTGIGDATMSQVNIYPNPTTTGTEINLQTVCDTVEVFNALGVKVAEYQNVDSIDALETAGIYVIRITNDGNVQNCRLVVK